MTPILNPYSFYPPKQFFAAYRLDCQYKEDFNGDENTAAFYAYIRHSKNIQIYEDITEISILNDKALKTVEMTARKYRYNDIFTEAAAYEIKNKEILKQIYDAAKYYGLKID